MPVIGERSFVVDHFPKMPKGYRYRVTPTKYFSLFDDGKLGWYIDGAARGRDFATRREAAAYGDGLLAAQAAAPAKE